MHTHNCQDIPFGGGGQYSHIKSTWALGSGKVTYPKVQWLKHIQSLGSVITSDHNFRNTEEDNPLPPLCMNPANFGIY